MSMQTDDVQGGVSTYACHYCQRTDGRQTRDHKLPRSFGGTVLAANIVRCCLMCNTIKDSRPYALFVLLFGDFLEQHGEEYRAADPDDGRAISTMGRMFNRWLRELQVASPEAAAAKSVSPNGTTRNGENRGAVDFAFTKTASPREPAATEAE